VIGKYVTVLSDIVSMHGCGMYDVARGRQTTNCSLIDIARTT